MNKTIIALLTGLLGFSLFAGDTSYAFTYQACLRDEHGGALTNSAGVLKRDYTVTVRLYNQAAGGSALWGHSYNVMTDDDGVFNLAISDDTGAVVVSNKLAAVFSTVPAGELFIGLTVSGSSGEIVPRQRIFATPFAAVANDVRAVSGDLTVGGKITFTDGDKALTISKDGILQSGATEAEVQTLKANGSATVAGELKAAGGVFTASGAGVTVKDQPLAVENGKLTVDGSDVVPVPVGGIIMWTKPELPDSEHWAICDGTSKNGIQLPDLRDRFIVGAGKSYAADATGGAASVAITASQLPSHCHTYVGDDMLQFIPGVGAHTWAGGYDASSVAVGNACLYNTSAAGGNQAHENRPPYYALYYIMRIK